MIKDIFYVLQERIDKVIAVMDSRPLAPPRPVKCIRPPQHRINHRAPVDHCFYIIMVIRSVEGSSLTFESTAARVRIIIIQSCVYSVLASTLYEHPPKFGRWNGGTYRNRTNDENLHHPWWRTRVRLGLRARTTRHATPLIKMLMITVITNI